MLNRSAHIHEDALRGLHPTAVESADGIGRLLERARAGAAVFHRGLNARVDLETADLERISDDCLVFRTHNFDKRDRSQVFLNFELDGRPYFFATERTQPFDGERLTVARPTAIFCAERRDRRRWVPEEGTGDVLNVELHTDDEHIAFAQVADLSAGGLGVSLEGALEVVENSSLELRFLDGERAGDAIRARVRNIHDDPDAPGWIRVGLAEGNGITLSLIDIEHRDTILGPMPDAVPAPRDAVSVQATGKSPEVQVVHFSDEAGHELVGLLDGYGELSGATAVILQNGWGQTKEALLPLARALVATFGAHDEPVTVLRFDGVNKRGESYKEPDCRLPGRECHKFVFSQGVADISACVNFLQADPKNRPAKIVLVSFSAGAIEARKAVANDCGENIDGWVSIVGSPDLQSMTRSISGGVDFVAGYDLGLEFGVQELLGVAIDIDELGRDGEKLGILHIDEARYDLAEIDVPVSWFHGQYDAWVDLDRVRDMLSHGSLLDRRLVTIPTAHRLENSSQASQAFQLVAHEVAQMALGRSLAPVAADPRDVRARRRVERARRPRVEADLRAFWHDYLLGRDESVGIELMTACSDYRLLMADQIEALNLQGGERIADLGCGTGSFIIELGRALDRPPDIQVIGFDHVHAALQRSRRRFLESEPSDDLNLELFEADLDVGAGRIGIPAQQGSFDAVLASLLLSYVERPAVLLEEMLRILRPGGTLVLSSLCRDADISRLYVESLAEMRVGRAAKDLPELDGTSLDLVARNFLNDAARILEFEEQGSFAFWEPDELAQMLEHAGFTGIETRRSFGTPAQAVVVSAQRPAMAAQISPEQRAFGT